MQDLTPAAERIVGDMARRHGVSVGAVRTLLRALVAGGGMAQFSHPELGGTGQWSQGGMVMIGDIFNQELKQRVSALCEDLASALRGNDSVLAAHGVSEGSRWWPPELGAPSSSGAQNGVRYAYFRASNRLAVEQDGRLTIHDTGDHLISGISQQRGGGRSLVLASQHGPMPITDLPLVGRVARTSSQSSRNRATRACFGSP